MELYVLDRFLRRSEAIDSFSSLIWAERYASYGDFELVIEATPHMRDVLTPDAYLTCDKSHRVMIIETVVDSSNEDGAVLSIKGRSIEKLLEDRVATLSTAGLSTAPKWEFTNVLPAEIVRTMFKTICVDGHLSMYDIIPYYGSSPVLPPGTIAEPEDVVSLALGPDSLYNSVKKICDLYGLGFRLLRHEVTSTLFFDVFTGVNRTSRQTLVPAVIFSEDHDNLTDTTELISIANYKNLAIVFAPNGVEYVYADLVEPSTTIGFNRKAVVVTASDISLAAGVELTTALIQRGKEALADYRVVRAFDGEIPQSGSYTYGDDYNLGDLVEQRTADDLTSIMRVTEQIFISDAEGERSYPTLVIDTLIEPGTWYGWSNGQVWDDALGVWGDV